LIRLGRPVAAAESGGILGRDAASSPPAHRPGQNRVWNDWAAAAKEGATTGTIRRCLPGPPAQAWCRMRLPDITCRIPAVPDGRIFSILPGLAILSNARKTPIQPASGKL